MTAFSFKNLSNFAGFRSDPPYNSGTSYIRSAFGSNDLSPAFSTNPVISSRHEKSLLAICLYIEDSSNANFPV